ncbi:hypothetical protein, partial [Pseudomonas citronellolis]|uniref:hypothetical protein n=1 Tax=Pseudomonas citronellolis TaxID=53408 RepID=UPI001874B405
MDSPFYENGWRVDQQSVSTALSPPVDIGPLLAVAVGARELLHQIGMARFSVFQRALHIGQLAAEPLDLVEHLALAFGDRHTTDCD